nr:hypothetical protein HK105_007385 [Polyrhizophydium stewartii]
MADALVVMVEQRCERLLAERDQLIGENAETSAELERALALHAKTEFELKQAVETVKMKTLRAEHRDDIQRHEVALRQQVRTLQTELDLRAAELDSTRLQLQESAATLNVLQNELRERGAMSSEEIERLRAKTSDAERARAVEVCSPDVEHARTQTLTDALLAKLRQIAQRIADLEHSNAELLRANADLKQRLRSALE